MGHYQAQVEDNWEYVHFEENFRAAKQAYAMAGIVNPCKEIDLAIAHDCFTITELV